MSGYLWRGKPDLERINAAIMADRERRPEAQPQRVVEPFAWGRHARTLPSGDARARARGKLRAVPS